MSRPKHTLLVLDVSEPELSLTRLVLKTAGYRVSGFTDPEQALVYLSGNLPDVVLASAEAGGFALAVKIRQLHLDTKVILFSRKIRTCYEHCDHQADRFYAKGCHGSAVLLQEIKLLTQRKRGPKAKAA